MRCAFVDPLADSALYLTDLAVPQVLAEERGAQGKVLLVSPGLDGA